MICIACALTLATPAVEVTSNNHLRASLPRHCISNVDEQVESVAAVNAQATTSPSRVAS